ncbi:ImmA/IrrE family metallo-endopeptidase [Cellulomonas fimi]|uniref:ImmA/IrrE family metallo-endopeptidase n=1 Tax=Cellulomonas fimi TaxID=1708 RepID=A0A7Y0LYK4_CELFI|nr:XRE family transcriptional regulator [Cellulomonas fimi]NMR20470.1 ImmA/IrrE family metallo-endopeptidase [Cellulomonas fimi]
MSGLGEVLATARRARGLTQDELSRAAEVTQAALSRYEHDLRTPEPEVLGRLALALGVTPSLLEHGGRMEGGIAAGAHMRRRATAKPTVWRELEARLNMARLHTARLMDEISVRADRQVPSFDPVDVEPETAARLLRAQWRMPVGPVHSLSAWMDAAGVIVVEQDFGSAARADGLSQWSGPYPVVLVNLAAPTDRKRLTLAHELGHLVLHSSYLDDEAETQANRFAAELLMPEDEIRPMLRARLTPERLVELKRYWGVSMQALVERAFALRVLTPAQRGSLYKVLSARGMRRREPASEELTPEVPRLTRHIAESLRSRGLTDDEIADLAGYASASVNALFVVPERPRLQLV